MAQNGSDMDVDDGAEDRSASQPQASGSSLSTPRIPAINYKERLIVTKIVMENFKSYAGVQEIGPLHHCFTAIVGPNGSGKSNVIDAILFVFGRQAKQLRLGRVSEFIHNSDHHKNLDYARVSVHFQSIQVTVRS
jgi:structural maintenance of chromosome 4